jgi:pimeloyl-ACP methyl ester carboxylesterase
LSASAQLPARSYTDWVCQNKLSGAAAQEGAILTGDGLSNLLKFSLGLPALGAAASMLPAASIEADRLVYRYSQPVGLLGVTTSVETSTDLFNWSSPPIDPIVEETGAAMQVFKVDFPAAQSRLFVRLRVTTNGDPTTTIESWTNLDAWTIGRNGAVIASGNRLYSCNAGRDSGANHPYVVQADEVARVIATVHYVNNAPSGGIFIGLNKNDAGLAPTSGLIDACGILMSSSGVYKSDRGALSFFPGTTNPPSGDYTFSIVVDSTYFSVVVTSAAGSFECQARFLRSGFPIGNIEVFNSDTRRLDGSSIGTLAARRDFASITPRTGLEGISKTVEWGGDGTNSWQIAVPATYDSRFQAPLVILFHGNGGTESEFATFENAKVVRDAFLAAGYICVSANYDAGYGCTWGVQAALDAYFAAYMHCLHYYNVGLPVLYGNSMGGLESLLTLAGGRIPAVAWIGTVPVCSLMWARSTEGAPNANGHLDFGVTVKSNYGIAQDWSDFAAKTAGHDPLMIPASAFRCVPMMAIVATDDVAVPLVYNWHLFSPRCEPAARELVTYTTTGGHNAGMLAWTATMTEFADRYAKPDPLK